MAKDYAVNVTINGQDNATKVIGSFGGEFARQLGIMSAAAVAVAATFAGFTIAADFEAEMSAVQAVAGATRPEMEALRKQAIDLGADTAFSASQVAQGMEELAKAGMRPGQVMEGIGPMLNLAAAGGLALADAAGIAAVSLATFNLPATEAGHVADVLAQMANMSLTSVQGMGEALKYAGGPAAALGLAVEDTAAAIGLMANCGLDASMAGVSLNAALMALVNPSKEAQHAIDALGLKTTDAHGQFLPFKDILAQLPPGLLDTQKGMAAINTIFGERGQRGMIALIQEGTEKFVDFKTAAVESAGAAQKMGETRLDNLNGAIEQLKGSLESLAIGFFTGGDDNSLSGGMKRFITDGLVPVVNSITNLVTQSNGFSSVMNMVLDGWKLILSDIVVPVISGWTQLTTLMGGVLDGLDGLLVGFGTALLYTLKGINDLVAESFDATLGVVKNTIITVLNFLGEQWTTVLNGLLTPVRGVLGMIGVEIAEFDWTPLTTTPSTTFTQVWNDAQENFGIAKNAMSLGIDEFKTSVVGACVDINTNMNGPTGPAATITKAAEDAVKGAAGEMQRGGVAIPNALKPHFDAVGNEFHSLTGKLALEVDFFGSYIKEAGLGDKIAWSMKEGWNDYLKAVPTIQDSVMTGMKGIANTMETTISGGFQAIITGGSVDFVDGMRAIGNAAAKALGDTLSAEVMKRMIGPAVNAIIDLFSGGFSSILSSAGSMLSSLSSQISGVQGQAGGIGGILGGAGGIAGGLAGGGAILAAGYGLIKIIDSFMPESKTIADQITNFKAKNAIVTDDDVVKTLLAQLNNPALNQYGSYKDGTLQIGLYNRVYDALNEAQKAELLGAGGNVTRWAKSFASDKWNQTGAGSSLVTPGFHQGGMIPGEGLFLGLSGEGVLNRRAMGNIGGSGLAALNAGAAPAAKIIQITINAWDGEDVERVLDRKIIPMMMEKSEAGVTIIHENGVKSA